MWRILQYLYAPRPSAYRGGMGQDGPAGLAAKMRKCKNLLWFLATSVGVHLTRLQKAPGLDRQSGSQPLDDVERHVPGRSFDI